jgi:Type VI secretion system/phage-baseplate injector OB domain
MATNADLALRDLAIDRRTKFWGKYRGIVTDVSSGDDLGKVTVQVPDVYGADVTMLAWPCVPFAGPNHGFVVVPEVGDGVWVEFEGGDPSHPIWVGCWWAQNDMPSPSDTNVRTWITSGGLKVVLDDGQSQLSLLHPQGASIVLSDSDITLSIGSTSIKLESSGITVTGNVQVSS